MQKRDRSFVLVASRYLWTIPWWARSTGGHSRRTDPFFQKRHAGSRIAHVPRRLAPNGHYRWSDSVDRFKGWNIREGNRGPNSFSCLHADIQPTGTVTDFQDKLATACGVSSEVQEIRCGFPPKQLALPADPAATSVQSWGLQNGDSLIVSKSAQQSRPLPQTVLQPAQAIQQPAQAVQQAAQAEVGRAALAPAAAADDYARRQQMVRCSRFERCSSGEDNVSCVWSIAFAIVWVQRSG